MGAKPQAWVCPMVHVDGKKWVYEYAFGVEGNVPRSQLCPIVNLVARESLNAGGRSRLSETKLAWILDLCGRNETTSCWWYAARTETGAARRGWRVVVRVRAERMGGTTGESNVTGLMPPFAA